MCFPEKSQAERDQLLRESFRDLGIGLFEFARAWWGSAAPMRRTVRIEGLEHSAPLRAQGRGVLLVEGAQDSALRPGKAACKHGSLS